MCCPNHLPFALDPCLYAKVNGVAQRFRNIVKTLDSTNNLVVVFLAPKQLNCIINTLFDQACFSLRSYII